MNMKLVIEFDCDYGSVADLANDVSLTLEEQGYQAKVVDQSYIRTES